MTTSLCNEHAHIDLKDRTFLEKSFSRVINKGCYICLVNQGIAYEVTEEEIKALDNWWINESSRFVNRQFNLDEN